MNAENIECLPEDSLTPPASETPPELFAGVAQHAMSDYAIHHESLDATLVHTAPPGHFRESVGDGFDHDNVAHLLEALYRDEPLHGTAMQALNGAHRYNWLDAAPLPWLRGNADGLILSLAGKMAIRHTALQEMKFAHAGYTDCRPVARGIISESFRKEVEKHTAFYLKTRERLEKLSRLDSINRRSRLAVLRFPAKEPEHAPVDLAGDNATAGVRDLVQVYETMRRSHIAEFNPIVRGPGFYRRDWLDDATRAELEESTDAILFAGHARMAIRMSLRLEKGWRQAVWHNNEPGRFKNDLLHDLRKERDLSVDSYLKLREAQARVAHNQGIVDRAEADASLSRPRRPRMRTKKAAGA